MQRHDQFGIENFRMLRVQSLRSLLYQAMVGMEPSSDGEKQLGDLLRKR